MGDGSWASHYTTLPSPSALVTSKPTEPTSTHAGCTSDQEIGETVGAVSGLSWSDLNFYVSSDGGEKRVLRSLFGHVPCGHLMAIMGPSGSGKSTLLDILAMRKTVGRIQGSVRVNGQTRRPSSFQHACAYIPQENVLLPTLTVLETMQYYAEMQLPRHESLEDKLGRINKMLHLVGLSKAEACLVGGALPGGLRLRGISGGEQKRLAIAAAMLSEPAIVFADEPTSGLDAFASLRVLEVIKDLAVCGKPVVITIHQPRGAVWRLFDGIYLISEGRLLYAGHTLGVAQWFESLGFTQPKEASLAEWLLDLVAVGFDKDGFRWPCFKNAAELDVAASNFQRSDHAAQLLSKVSADCAGLEGAENAWWPRDLARKHEDHLARLASMRTLLWRHILNYSRNLGNLGARLALGLLSGLLIGCCYSGLATADSTDPRSLASRLGALFFICLNVVLSPFCSMSLFVGDRRFYAAESAAQLYSATAYYLPFVLCETTVNAWAAGCVWSPAWLLAGMPKTFLCYFRGLVACQLLQLCGAQIAIFSALLLPNQELAFVMAVAINIVSISTAGVLVKTSAIPMCVRWLRLMSPTKYAFQALAVNQLSSQRFNVSAQVAAVSEALGHIARSPHPSAWYLRQWPVQKIFTRVLSDVLDAVDPCLLDTVHTGEEALRCLELDEPSSESVLPSFRFLFVHLLCLHLLSWLCLRHLHKEKR